MNILHLRDSSFLIYDVDNVFYKFQPCLIRIFTNLLLFALVIKACLANSDFQQVLLLSSSSLPVPHDEKLNERADISSLAPFHP